MFIVSHRARCLLTGLSLLTASACGGDDDGASSPMTPAPATPAPATPVPSAQPALFGVQTLLFGETGRHTYVALLPSLDTQQTVMLSTAREFPEYSPTDAVNGAVIVADGEQPQVTRYAISASNEWQQQQTVSFSQFTSEPINAAIYASAEKAYVPFDKTNHVRWNPATFTVVGEVGASPAIPLMRDGLEVWRGNNYALSGTRFFQPYYWADGDYTKYSQLSQINVIDTTTDTVKAPIDVPCPHMHLTSQDDQGNIYFSNGQLSIPSAVVDPTQPRNCFARVAAGTETLDPGSVVEFRSLTDGREGSNLFYIGSGRALFNVYHAERDNFGPTPDVDQVDSSANYHIWTVDLATRKAAIMDGIDYGGGQFLTFRIDGRSFVAMPEADYSKTSVFEVTTDGRAEKRFDVEGWTTKIFRIR